MTLKQEMRSKLRLILKPAEQTEFEFRLINGEPADPSFVWEDDDEFRYNGSIYDVIEKKIAGDKLKLRCIDDVKEAALVKKMETLQKEQHGDQQKSRAVLLQQLLSLLFFHPYYCEPAAESSVLVHVDHNYASFASVAKDIVTPPPRQTGFFIS